jgi:molybdenum cofactor guanylyltransferase
MADEIIVSISAKALEPRFSAILPNARFVYDRRTQRGPIEGLERGFESARGDVVIVVPCDAPLIRRRLLALLLDRLGDGEASVPRRGAFDPVRAVYRREAVLREFARSQGSIVSPSALVDRLSAHFVDEATMREVDPDLVSFLDVNFPEDLTRAERLLLENRDL